MTAKEALEIIKGKYPDMSVIECLEFPDFYGFALTEKGEEDEPTGGGYITVSKEDGTISAFTPTMDLELFLSAKFIDLK